VNKNYARAFGRSTNPLAFHSSPSDARTGRQRANTDADIVAARPLLVKQRSTTQSSEKLAQVLNFLQRHLL
jgi:hypothetical protein